MPLLPHELEIYYKHIFPVTSFWRWLSYGEDVVFRRREFSFTLPGDVYVRFKSFENAKELGDALVKYKPEKIDLGAVYNHPPKMKEAVSVFVPQQRELVFDIDISDYDDVRFCCNGKGICDRCWHLMVAAAHVINSFMRQTFGFHQLLWVFSGRRGLHCWVADASARALSDECRAAVAKHMSVHEGSTEPGKVRLNIMFELKKTTKDGRKALHPTIDSMFTTLLEPAFGVTYLDGDAGANPNSILNEAPARRLFELLQHFAQSDVQRRPAAGPKATDPVAVARDILKSGGGARASGREKWDQIVKVFGKDKALSYVPKAVIFAMVYPRLDVNVSTHQNHLLKAPFVIHPATGNVCVPLDFAGMSRFSPQKCVTLKDLLKLYENGKTPLPREVSDVFEEFLRGIEEDCRLARVKAEELQHAKTETMAIAASASP